MTMPHMSSGGSEDFYSTDEVKVYKDEGNKDEEKRSSENLSEEKLGLVTESEEGKNSNYGASDKGSASRVDDGKVEGVTTGQATPGSVTGFPFLPSPYASYPNGGKFAGVVQPMYPGFVFNEFAQPPPAHMGIGPVHTDPKTAFLLAGLPRPPVYAYPPHGQFPPIYGPDFPQVPWHRPGGYPITSGAFTGPPSLSISRYGHPILPPGIPHPGMPHPGMLPGHKSDIMGSAGMQDSHRLDGGDESRSRKSEAPEKRKNYIKKPLNAFMLFMKEMRPKVIAECTLRESSAINQILGRKWHALDRAEQAKYYEMARKEKDLHMQLYPGWSARDSYAVHQKKKKRKKSDPGSMQCTENKNMAGECPNAKKCRARYGLEQQSQWCSPCRRKKKCIRYSWEDGASTDGEEDYYDISPYGVNSAVSTCDTDSTQGEQDQDSPHPRDSSFLRQQSHSFQRSQSPLSPLISEEEEEISSHSISLIMGTRQLLDLSFRGSTSSSAPSLPLSLSRLPGSSSLTPLKASPCKPLPNTTLLPAVSPCRPVPNNAVPAVKVDVPVPLNMCSPRTAAT